eukprot:587149-Pelagomonas_calceolata.AAC.1
MLEYSDMTLRISINHFKLFRSLPFSCSHEFKPSALVHGFTLHALVKLSAKQTFTSRLYIKPFQPQA